MYRIRGWDQHQHYTDGRKISWIKLHRSLLDDRAYHSLDGDSAKILTLLWLLAAEDDGRVPGIGDVAWRIRIPESEVARAIQVLLTAGFLEANEGPYETVQTEPLSCTRTEVSCTRTPGGPYQTVPDIEPLPYEPVQTPSPSRTPRARATEEKRGEKKRTEQTRARAREEKPEQFDEVWAVVEEELHQGGGDPDTDRSVLAVMLGRIPAQDIIESLRGYGVRRRRGEFVRFADRPSLRLWWTKGNWSDFFGECQRAWKAEQAKQPAGIGDILRRLEAG